MDKKENRVIFSKGEQHKFLEKAQALLLYSRSEISKKLKVHPRTYCGWYLERGSMPLGSVREICTLTNLKLPSNITIKEPFWSVHKAARIGGVRRYQKYGSICDEEYRKKKWLEWWDKKGRFQLSQNQPRPIHKPARSEMLAEFVGIMLGDGGMTPYQICITLGYKADQEYSTFLRAFLKKLFQLSPSIHERNKSYITHVISRKELVDYCVSLGLCIGNKVKQQVDMPSWIKKDEELIKACIRGLMDTDGCIFQECHSINARRYCYPRIFLVSYSNPLRRAIYDGLIRLGFSARLRSGRSVTLEKRSDIIRYFSFIGTHNPKHQKRFEAFIGGVG